MADSRKLRFDLHVHTGRYSQCAETVDPYQLGDAGIRAGLDGLVITEHDVLWQDEELEILRHRTPEVRIFRGIEVTARGCHVVVIGIDDAALLERGMAPTEVIDVAHSLGGIAILAHPFRDSDPASLPLHQFDAIEVASTSFSRADAVGAIELAKGLGLPSVASSDAHALSRVGWAWTELSERPRDERHLAALLKQGSGRPRAPRPFPGEGQS
jgi:hypothetical protein